MPTFERLTPADRQRIGRKGGRARWASRPAPKPVVKTSPYNGAITDPKTYQARKDAGRCVACGERDAAPRITLEEPTDQPELNRLVWRTLQSGAAKTSRELANILHRDRETMTDRLITLEKSGWVKRTGRQKVGSGFHQSATAVTWGVCTPKPQRQTLCVECIAFRADYRARMAQKQEAERVKLEDLRVAELKPFRKDVVVYEYGERREFVSIWDGRGSVLDAIQARA